MSNANAQRIVMVIFVLLLICTQKCTYAQSTGPHPAEIQGMTIVEDECDMDSQQFQRLGRYEQMDFTRCITFFNAVPISTKRFVVVPQGYVNFIFNLFLNDQAQLNHVFPNQPGQELDAAFRITVRAWGPNPGEFQQNTGTACLYGSRSHAAPLDARDRGTQAALGGTARGKLGIPLHIDWAESRVSFNVTTWQGGCGEGAAETFYPTSVADPDPLGGSWTDYASFSGPDLSSVNPGITLPGALSKNEFALFVTPAARFQLPVVPVAIVYAPLGNKGTSSYQITTTTGSNTQVGINNTMQTSLRSDDKTTYHGGLTAEGDLGVKFSLSEGLWDTSVERGHENSYGITGSIINSDDIGVTFVNPATTSLPLSRISYFSQPFWSDLFIATLNAQYALWNYPGGPVIQPLGSSTTLQIPVQQLLTCLNQPKALKPSSGDPNACPKANQEPTPDQAHLVCYASEDPSEGITKWTWLSSQECADILSLDEFHAKRTQSATPLSWRKLYGGNVATSSGTTIESSHSTELLFGQNQNRKLTSTITASQTSSLALSADVLSLFQVIGIDFSRTNSATHSTTLSYTASNSASLQSQSRASTTIQDSSGRSKPVNVLQDLIFQGLAVQDTDMHYSSLPQQVKTTVSICATLKSCGVLKLPGVPVLKSDYRRRDQQPSIFIEDSVFGKAIINQNKKAVRTRTELYQFFSRAADRHFDRPIPPPPAAQIEAMTAGEALHVLRVLETHDPLVSVQ